MNTSSKINGWLYLPATGLIIACITGTVNYLGLVSLFLSKWINNQPISYSFASFIVISGALYIAFLYIATFCFFRKNKKTRRFMVIYYTYSFFINGGVVLFSWFYLHLDVEVKEVALLLSVCVGFFVWVPYFLYSKRIPVVFCN